MLFKSARNCVVQFMMVNSADQSISKNCVLWFKGLFIYFTEPVFFCTVRCAYFFFVLLILYFPIWVNSTETTSTCEVNINENVNI